MKRTTKLLLMLVVLAVSASLVSCELFGIADNPVSPRLKVKSASLTLKVGDTKKCPVSASTRAKLLYGSSDEAIAVVDQNGLVTGVAEGTAYITVIATNADNSALFFDESAIITVTVIDEDSPEVKKGTISYATTSISKTYGDEPFTNPLTKTGNGKVTYTSSNTAVAVVNSETGQVTIKGNGETTITATVEDTNKYTYAEGYTGTYDEKAHGIKVTAPEGATIKYGTTEGSYTLTTSPTYTNAGTYTVYYQVSKMDYTPVTGSATVEIAKAEGTISYATTSISKKYGDANFTNELTLTGDGKATYASSNTNVATVSATGEITIKGDGTATIKATVSDTDNYTYATKEATYTLGVGTATMTVTATGFTGFYDGKAHGITVTAPTGATIKYGTAAGTYDKTASPTYTNAGNYTVYYEVTKDNFTTVTGSATVTINKADMEVTATGYAGTYDAQAHGIKVNVTSPSGATIKYGTTTGTYDKTANPTYTNVGTYTVYYEVSKDNYTTVTGSATVEITKADMIVSATGYSGTYDGSAHGITVNAPTGATVKYGTTAGNYTQTSSPTYTNADTYTVYYQVTKDNYTTVTNSAQVIIAKKAAAISYANDVTRNYGDSKFTNDLADTGDAKDNGKVSYSSSNTGVATINSTNGEVNIVGDGTTTITATVTEENNYAYATKTATYTLTVIHTGNSGTQDYTPGSQTW